MGQTASAPGASGTAVAPLPEGRERYREALRDYAAFKTAFGARYGDLIAEIEKTNALYNTVFQIHAERLKRTNIAGNTVHRNLAKAAEENLRAADQLAVQTTRLIDSHASLPADQKRKLKRWVSAMQMHYHSIINKESRLVNTTRSRLNTEQAQLATRLQRYGANAATAARMAEEVRTGTAAAVLGTAAAAPAVNAARPGVPGARFAAENIAAVLGNAAPAAPANNGSSATGAGANGGRRRTRRSRRGKRHGKRKGTRRH